MASSPGKCIPGLDPAANGATKLILHPGAAGLHGSLLDHGVCNTHELGHVCTEHEIVGCAEFNRGVADTRVDTGHNGFEPGINLFERPALRGGICAISSRLVATPPVLPALPGS